MNAMHSAADHAAAVNMHAANASAQWVHLGPAQQPPQNTGGATPMPEPPNPQETALMATGANSGMLSEETRKRQLQEILQQIMTITEQSLDAAQARLLILSQLTSHRILGDELYYMDIVFQEKNFKHSQNETGTV